MGWSFRKSFRLFPGVKVNLSKGGPRLSIGVPGVRGSIGVDGKARIYGSAGPLRYQKAVTVGAARSSDPKGRGFIAFVRRVFSGR